jgi:hypothetical protein
VNAGRDGKGLMRVAMSRLNLSARAYHHTRSVKLAHTIADLAGNEESQSVSCRLAKKSQLILIDKKATSMFKLSKRFLCVEGGDCTGA